MPLIDQVVSDVAQTLKRAMEEDRAIDIAQIHFIGLDRIRKSAGDAWPTIKDRVRVNSLTFLRASLGDADITIPCGDGFLVIYAASASQQELARRSAELRDSLNSFYLGDEALRALSVSVEARSVSPSALSDIVQEGAAAAVNGALGLDIAVEERRCGVDRRRAGVSPPTAQAVLVPLWSPRARAFAGVCATSAIVDGRRMIYGGTDSGGDRSALDLSILDLAAAHAESSLARRRVAAIMVSVHSSVMSNRASRHAYLTRLGALDPALRRMMIARLTDVELGCPLLSLGDWVGFLKGHVPRVAIELHANEKALGNVAMSGAWAAGFRAPPHGEGLAGSARERVRQLIVQWTGAFRRQELRVFVDDLRDAAVAEAAASAGVDFSASPTLWPEPPAAPTA